MTAQFKIIEKAEAPTDDRRGRKRIYPWADVPLGGAFDVPADPKDRISDSRHPAHNRMTASAASRNLREAANKTGVRWVVRYLREEGVVRCWKVSAQ